MNSSRTLSHVGYEFFFYFCDSCTDLIYCTTTTLLEHDFRHKRFFNSGCNAREKIKRISASGQFVWLQQHSLESPKFSFSMRFYFLDLAISTLVSVIRNEKIIKKK